jgi:hypothetical protein
VAVGVSNQPPDVEHLEPMLQRISSSAGKMPSVMTMDAGYWSEDNFKACSDQGIGAYIATGRLPHGQPLPPKRVPCPEMPMPQPTWPASSEANWDQRSTPGIRRSWSR